MTPTEDLAAIVTAQAQLAQLNAAIAAILDPTVRNYTFDTGQTIQTTRRNELPDMYASVEALENRITTLQARVTGGGVTQGVPGW